MRAIPPSLTSGLFPCYYGAMNDNSNICMCCGCDNSHFKAKVTSNRIGVTRAPSDTLTELDSIAIAGRNQILLKGNKKHHSAAQDLLISWVVEKNDPLTLYNKRLTRLEQKLTDYLDRLNNGCQCGDCQAGREKYLPKMEANIAKMKAEAPAT